MECIHCGGNIVAKKTVISWPKEGSQGKLACDGSCETCDSPHVQSYNLDTDESVLEVLTLLYNVAD